jgi:hypothetical protein
MAALVWTCTSGNESQRTVNLTTEQYPTCAGGGVWIEQPTYTPWWAYEIPGDQVADLLSALIFFAAVVVVCVEVDRAIRSRK